MFSNSAWILMRAISLRSKRCGIANVIKRYCCKIHVKTCKTLCLLLLSNMISNANILSQHIMICIYILYKGYASIKTHSSSGIWYAAERLIPWTNDITICSVSMRTQKYNVLCRDKSHFVLISSTFGILCIIVGLQYSMLYNDVNVYWQISITWPKLKDSRCIIQKRRWSLGLRGYHECSVW